MKPARFPPKAEAEFLDAVAYYEGQQSGLGVALRQEVEAVVGLVRQSPEMFAVRPGDGLRKCPVRWFPYAVYYLELDTEILDRGGGPSEAEARIVGGAVADIGREKASRELGSSPHREGL